jgi:hypothetical protein
MGMRFYTTSINCIAVFVQHLNSHTYLTYLGRYGLNFIISLGAVYYTSSRKDKTYKK